MMVIGLCGGAGSGKTTVAQRLIERWGFAEYTFAAPIRGALMDAFGVSADEFAPARKEQPNDKLGGRSLRYAMRTLGTEWARAHLGADIWVQVAARRLESMRRSGIERVVIHDVRFENEAKFIRDVLGGRLWLVKNPRVRYRGSEHVSEEGIDLKYVHRGILNDRGIDELWATVDEYAKPMCEVATQ